MHAPIPIINCFWFVVGIPSGLPTNPLIALTTAIVQYMFAAPLLILRQNSLLFALVVYLYL